MKQLEWWEREHRVSPSVTLAVGTSPIDNDWVVRAEGWQLPSHFRLRYPSCEAAQRAADDVLLEQPAARLLAVQVRRLENTPSARVRVDRRSQANRGCTNCS